MHPLELFKYCPKCGSPHFEVNNEKSKRCADCGFVYYFNSSAATVAFILNDKNELLVCRRGKEPAKGTLTCPVGLLICMKPARKVWHARCWRNRLAGGGGCLSVLIAQHLSLFRISGTYIGSVLSL